MAAFLGTRPVPFEDALTIAELGEGNGPFAPGGIEGRDVKRFGDTKEPNARGQEKADSRFALQFGCHRHLNCIHGP